MENAKCYAPQILVGTEGLPREQWLEYRRKGIGGSDAAAVLGISPFRTGRDLYYDKLNIVTADDAENWVQLEVGTLLEPLVAKIFAHKTGYKIYRRPFMFRHPKYPWMLADLDYMVELPDGTTAILEIKTTNYNAKDNWWYKGFEPDLSCRGYRFVMGKNVTPEANCASNGFHCAEDPLDCLSYYGDMNRSIYCLVQPGGDIDEDDRDSKIACTELTILRQLTRKEFFLHALAYMVDHPGRKVSDKVQREHSTSRNGYAIVRGKTPAACGKLGDILAFARERRETEAICQIAVVEVDGEKILPDVWYDIDFVKREAVQK